MHNLSRMMNQLNDEPSFNILFVKTVEQFPIVYDYTLPEYSNRSLVDKTWCEIAKKVNVSVGLCKARWKNIRGCYLRNLRNKPIDCSSADSKAVRPYYLLQQLEFLKSYTNPRAKFKNLNVGKTKNLRKSNNWKADKSSDTKAEVDEELVANDTTTEDTSSRSLMDTEDPETEETVNEVSEESSPEPSVIGCTIQAKSNSNQDKSTIVSLPSPSRKRTMSSNQQNSNGTSSFAPRTKPHFMMSDDMDGFMSFMKSLLPEIENFTQSQKRECKREFLKIVCQIADRNERSKRKGNE